MKHSKNNKTLLLIIFFALTVILTIIGFYLNSILIKPQYSYKIIAWFKTIILFLSIISFLIFSYSFYKISKSKFFINFIFTFFTVFSILILFELIFTFYTPSTNVFTDLSNKIWQKRFFHPINKLGYRDEEPIENKNLKNIFVVGDSFVAGHGIKYEEMFTTILKENLKNKYKVFNLGVCGSHTDREFDSLINYPLKPNILILCYYHNDIESAMIKLNIIPKIKNPKDELSSLSKFIVDNSLLFNFLFSIKAKNKISREFMESDNNDLIAYLDEALWNYQRKALDKFYNYCKENKIRFIILYFPGLGEGISFTQALAGKKVENYCKERNVEFINVYPSIKNLPQSRRIANQFDQHPSAEVNKIVAEKILMNLKSNNE